MYMVTALMKSVILQLIFYVNDVTVFLHHSSLVIILTNGYWMHTKWTSLIGYPVVHLVQ